MTPSGSWEWITGGSVIHLIDRADVREGDDRMVLSLCKQADIAYDPAHQVRAPRKKLCGRCADVFTAHIDAPNGLSP